MTGRILLHGMVFHGFHGVHPTEQTRGQPFEVDLSLTLDLAPAARSDRLEDTVDYAAIHALCRRIVEQERFHLLEALAGRLLDGVLAASPRVSTAAVVVRKPAVDLGGPLDYAAVEASKSRSC